MGNCSGFCMSSTPEGDGNIKKKITQDAVEGALKERD